MRTVDDDSKSFSLIGKMEFPGIYFERERAHEWVRAERERERERTPSRFHTVSAEPC